MFPTVLHVAAGGAIGASLRYAVSVLTVRAVGTGFPAATLVVNVVGSFLMGLFVVYAGARGVSHLSPFVAVGVLGGFTTFSAFSFETVMLIERGDVPMAILYLIASVMVSIGALAIGMALARAMFA